MTEKETSKPKLIQIDLKVTFDKRYDEESIYREVLEVDAVEEVAACQQKETITYEQLITLLKPLLHI
jgi:hypothetical protein